MSGIIKFTISHEEDIRTLEQLLSQYGKGEQKPAVGFLIEEFRSFDFSRINIESEFFGNFEFNILYDNEYILWISISEDEQTISIYGVEYNWYSGFADYKLQEIIFPFYKDIFAGKYEIENVTNSTTGYVSSSITYKSETKKSIAAFAALFSRKSKRTVTNSKGINFYKTKS